MNLRQAVFGRAPRQVIPFPEAVELDLPSLPDDTTNADFHWVIVASPLLGFFAMSLFYVARGGATSPVTLLPLAMLAGVSIMSTVMLQRWRGRQVADLRRRRMLDYERALDLRRTRLNALHDAVRALLERDYPPPGALLERALEAGERLWERRPEDADFMAYRAGAGIVQAPVKWRVQQEDLERDERAAALIQRYRHISGVPMTFSLWRDGSTALVGRRPAVLGLARAIIAQIAIAHAPHDVQIALIAPTASVKDWDWLTWLPHIQQQDALTLAFTPDAVRNLLGYLGQWVDSRRETQTTNPHLFLLVDEPHLVESDAAFTTLLRQAAQLGASVLCMANAYEQVPGDCQSLIYIDADATFRYVRAGQEVRGEHADFLDALEAAFIGRALAPVTINEPGAAGAVPPQVDFLEMYGVTTVRDLVPRILARWRQPNDRMLPRPVPIGRESLASTALLMLDEEHHGPHGMLAGTTGSGKSELLQSLVCALAIEHDPRLLSLLLIDFKGGSTFNAFTHLPHTVGMVTNLDPIEVRRVLEALKSEIERRQHFLKQVKLRDIHQYHRFHSTEHRLQSPDYQPLPHLVILVDEFAQLAREMPEFMNELVKTVQVGRSLGLHLVLGTQSPMDVITDEMNANLQFRICLRVQNADASRAMLRRPDAAYLPVGRPGRGYLQVGERGLFKQFQAAYAGAEYAENAAQMDRPVLELVLPEGASLNLLESRDHAAGLREPYSVAHAVCDAIRELVQQKRIAVPPPLLLPALPERAGLGLVHSRLRGGCDGYRWQPVLDEQGSPVEVGSAPVGIVDDVVGRAQRSLWIHLNQTNQQAYSGHLLVVGAPATGKTTLIKSLALSLAALHPPERLHLYFLSFVGGLQDAAALPHAQHVVNGVDHERVRRLFGRFVKELDARLNGTNADCHWVLFVDQYEQLRDSYRDAHLADLERLIYEGRSVNIFVVLTLSTIHALPDRLRAVVPQRVAFQQANHADYVLITGRLQHLPDAPLPPGRCYVHDATPLLAQIFLPTFNPLAALDEAASTQQGLRQAVAALQEAYQLATGARGEGPFKAPAPLEELPARILSDQLPVPVADELVTVLGLRDDDHLSAYEVDWWNDGVHYLVAGPPLSGKTNLLRLAVLSAARQQSPQQLRYLLVDFNQRSLGELEPLKHVLRRITDPADLREQINRLSSELAAMQRMPQPPALALIIDDYDLTLDVLSGDYDLLNQMAYLLRYYRDLPLFVWVAGYFERASDPFIKQVLLRRAGFGLMHRDSAQRLNLRTAHLPSENMPVGRAYVPTLRGLEVVQTAWVDDVPRVVQDLNHNVWADEERAFWLTEAKSPPAMQAPPAARHTYTDAIDIDTQGLIDDLLSDWRQDSP